MCAAEWHGGSGVLHHLSGFSPKDPLRIHDNACNSFAVVEAECCCFFFLQHSLIGTKENNLWAQDPPEAFQMASKHLES